MDLYGCHYCCCCTHGCHRRIRMSSEFFIFQQGWREYHSQLVESIEHVSEELGGNHEVCVLLQFRSKLGLVFWYSWSDFLVSSFFPLSPSRPMGQLQSSTFSARSTIISSRSSPWNLSHLPKLVLLIWVSSSHYSGCQHSFYWVGGLINPSTYFSVCYRISYHWKSLIIFLKPLDRRLVWSFSPRWCLFPRELYHSRREDELGWRLCYGWILHHDCKLCLRF